ncbi:GtrA family protein [Elizabethkingia anophelis]|nr:GtrA family protein [Elizabethkingia anophelis]MCT3742698.1 GtrA family protein [Elizabethkingia anophelis]MCT3749889.1 GtrA family protein [Elizabethkingia anophelis]MCT3753279.1 GtrA family protein [Elizabethkingia anophelis]MCT3871149.1 GtrA family protein [Elizabethkingia anophelis]
MVAFIIKQKQILFFIIAGGLSAIVEIGLMKVFSYYIPEYIPAETKWHGISYPLSNILSTTCAIIFNYFLSIWFVFERGKHSKKKEFTYFMVVSFISTILSLIVFNLLFNNIFDDPIDLGVYVLSPIIVSKALAIVIISVLNFSIKKRVIFNG